MPDRRGSSTADRAEIAQADDQRAADAAPPSALTALAETELRLDRAIAQAREAAAAAIAEARRRAELAITTGDGEIERERARITEEIGRATELQLAAIATAARAEAVRFDAVRDGALDPIANQLADRLAAIALDEAP